MDHKELVALKPCEEGWNPNDYQGRSPEQVKAIHDEAVLLSVVGVAVLVAWGLWELGTWLVSLVPGI